MGTAGQTVGYIRVSSIGQNVARQDIVREGAEKVFEEKVSAGTRERPELDKMMNYVREGDHVQVLSLDRLARSLLDLINVVNELKEKGVSITFMKEGITFNPREKTDPYQELQFTLIGAFAQFERSISKERQREGIEKAKALGVYKGRKRILTDEQVAEADEQVQAGIPKARIARELKVSPSTLHQELKKLHAMQEVVMKNDRLLQDCDFEGARNHQDWQSIKSEFQELKEEVVDGMKEKRARKRKR